MMDDFGNQVAMHPSWIQRVERQLNEQSSELGRIGACLSALTEMQRETLEVMKGHARLDERLNSHAHRIEVVEAEIRASRAVPDKTAWTVIREWAPVVITTLGFLGVGIKMTLGG
jgi:hypothetical protein